MTRTATATFLVVEILFLAAAQGVGGWPWTAIGGAAIGALAVADFRPASLAMVVPGLVLTNSLVVRAFAATANVILINGYVNRIA